MTPLTIDFVRKRAEADAKTYGYYLTPQQDLLQMFLEGLKANEERYGYPVCPCRLGTGNIDLDRDIICPCDYRDPDVAEYGSCYCRLYVTKAVYESQNLPEVPERRPQEKIARAYGVPTAAPQVPQQFTVAPTPETSKPQPPPKQPAVKKKLWYCKQCGYVVYREDPPYICPICKAKREIFAEIDAKVELNG
ncbi:MAG: ferredoxin:glutaredoxin reductase [Candidatus Bathyarchaeota archaeon]|nr:ferredoxin:glutaredoxin reductase [Candidatus Bathyarchaeota archaeon]